MTAMDRLFVYGSLKTELAHGTVRRLVEQCLGRPEPARIAGRLYNLGPYPALVMARQRDEWVYGELVTIRNPRGCLPRLDEYEGYDPRRPAVSEFIRYKDQARRLADNRAIPCWVYRFAVSPPPRGRRLPQGVYPD